MQFQSLPKWGETWEAEEGELWIEQQERKNSERTKKAKQNQALLSELMLLPIDITFAIGAFLVVLLLWFLLLYLAPLLKQQ